MPNFRLFENYVPGTSKGACYLCNAAPRDGELVVDTGVEIPFEGLIGICPVCVGHMASLYGYVDAGAAAQAIHDAEQAQDAARRAEETAGKAVALADALSNYNAYRLEKDREDERAAKQAEEEANRQEAEAAQPNPQPEGEGGVDLSKLPPPPVEPEEGPKRDEKAAGKDDPEPPKRGRPRKQ